MLRKFFEKIVKIKENLIFMLFYYFDALPQILVFILKILENRELILSASSVISIIYLFIYLA